MKIELTKEDLGILPRDIKNLLGKLDYLFKDKEDDEIILNFVKEDTNELSITIIWRVLRNLKSRKHKIFISYQKNAKAYFDERHFFDSLTGRKSSIFSSSVPVHYETFTPVRPSLSKTQNEEIENILVGVTKNILTEDDELHKEIKIHIVECINNTFDHSESKTDNPAGILCSMTKKNYLDFCIADMGQGIKKAFLDNPKFKNEYSKLEDWEIVRRVTDKNISCNPVNARNPKYVSSNGGIGLYYLREFVKYHKHCKLVIISGRGYYSLDSNTKKERVANLEHKWLGTIVYFRIRIDQEKSTIYKDLAGKQFIEEFDKKGINIV